MWRRRRDLCGRKKRIDSHAHLILSFIFVRLPSYFLARFYIELSSPLLRPRRFVCELFSGCHQLPHCQGCKINGLHLCLTWLYTPQLLPLSISENRGLKPHFICLDWPFLNHPAAAGEKRTLRGPFNSRETGFK